MANDVSAPFPDLDWPDQAIISVNAGDSSAVIKKMTIHLSQDAPDELLNFAELPPIFVYGPNT